MTHVYCDTSNLELVRKSINEYKVDGVTTIPSIMRGDGVKNYKSHCLKLLKITKNKPLSVEVFADNYKEIYSQAKKISKWSKKLFVKIPIVNTKGQSLTSTINKLNKEGVKLNITAVFTFDQVKKIYKNIDNKSPVIISIFCGRIADNGIDPEIIVKKTIKLFSKNKKVKILWASTREVFNYNQAKRIKCHIITMSPKFIEKLRSKKITLSKYSIDTVKQFYKDGRSSKFKI